MAWVEAWKHRQTRQQEEPETEGGMKQQDQDVPGLVAGPCPGDSAAWGLAAHRP